MYKSRVCLVLPDSLSGPSDLTELNFIRGKFEIKDVAGKGWTYNDIRNQWELIEAGGLDKFAGGSGTVRDPYKIANAIHLWLVRRELDKHFELLKDIDLNRAGFSPIGSNRNRFKGVFDGKGRKIKNLRINRPRDKYVGLFRGVDRSGVVKNIGLENVDIKGKKYVGGLAGANRGKIENSYVTGRLGTGVVMTLGVILAGWWERMD